MHSLASNSCAQFGLNFQRTVWLQIPVHGLASNSCAQVGLKLLCTVGPQIPVRSLASHSCAQFRFKNSGRKPWVNKQGDAVCTICGIHWNVTAQEGAEDVEPLKKQEQLSAILRLRLQGLCFGALRRPQSESKPLLAAPSGVRFERPSERTPQLRLIWRHTPFQRRLGCAENVPS